MWFQNTAAIVASKQTQIKSTSCKRAEILLDVFSKHFISSATGLLYENEMQILLTMNYSFQSNFQ